MHADTVLDEAVDAFCEALGPRVRDLAASVRGVDGEAAAVDVQVEAYNLAGDPSAYPDQITKEGLKPWSASKLLTSAALISLA